MLLVHLKNDWTTANCFQMFDLESMQEIVALVLIKWTYLTRQIKWGFHQKKWLKNIETYMQSWIILLANVRTVILTKIVVLIQTP